MISWRSACIAIAALIAVLVVRACVNFFQQCWALRKFRGPLAFPVVGNCYDPKAIIFLRFLTSLRSRYGRVFTFFNFTKSFLVVCEPGLIRQILSDSKTFYKGTDYTAKFGRFFGEGLVTSNGEKHKKDRSMLMKFFARPSVLKYAQSINDVTIATVKEFLPSINSEVQINVEEMFAIMTLRNFLHFCCSMDFSHDPTFERKLCHMISQGSNSVGRIITFNLPLNPLIPHVARADKVVKTLVDVFTPIVGARRSLVAAGTAPSDPLTQMISHGLSDREIFEHLQTLVCAGHDTTAYFLSYMTYMLAMNPDKQEKLHRCLQDLGATADHFVDPDALAKCQYLQFVMMETLRLFAVIPAVSRVASKDVEFKDFNVTIPQGTNILIPFFVVNRDPELWENPIQFCPERFEGRGIDFTSAKDGFFPFSYGPRTCIGNVFAHVEAEIVISHLLLRYRFVADPTFKPIVTAGISLTTANGMRVLVQSR